jgi:hippurate hydrolase
MLDVNYPVTVNDDAAAAHTLAVAGGLVGPGRATLMASPVMGAEDWSYVLQEVPGSMAFLGAAPPGVRRPAPNHSNHMVIDESAMATGIALYAAMALCPPPGG